MKCPLKTQANIYGERITITGSIDCIKEECGQFDQANQSCTPVALNQNLVTIGNTLGELVKVLGRIETQLYNK